MDARKALFRAKLREQKQEKRISSPLVRYNENDQPVCRVCDVTLKSESLWAAHQASRKHHEAIEHLKAAAAGSNSSSAKQLDPPTAVQKPPSQTTLPADFFDKNEPKRQKNDEESGVFLSGSSHANDKKEPTCGHMVKTNVDSMSSGQFKQQLKQNVASDKKQAKATLPKNFFEDINGGKPSNQHSQTFEPVSLEEQHGTETFPSGFLESNNITENMSANQIVRTSETFHDSVVKQKKGFLPEGFFDNKDADLRARGIEPVKVDINDAYKEFEKEIQDNLQEVDDRLEEEEIDAADIREEFESLEQREYRERVEMVKKRLIEVKTARLAKGQKRPSFMGDESSDESSSDGDDNEEENLLVDWRAKHL